MEWPLERAASFTLSQTEADMEKVSSDAGEEIIPSNGNEVAYRKLCGRAAVVLSLAHALSVCGMAFQSHWRADRFALINFSIWLSPILLPLVFRKSCALVIICAIPILAIFFTRVHLAWQLYSRGTNSINPNGDWAWWVAAYLGVISIFVVAFWLLIRATILVVNYVNRANRTRRAE
jgi:hypothetical protein